MMSTDKSRPEGYLTGQLLIAMPQMRDPRFTRTVIYMCAHSSTVRWAWWSIAGSARSLSPNC